MSYLGCVVKLKQIVFLFLMFYEILETGISVEDRMSYFDVITKEETAHLSLLQWNEFLITKINEIFHLILVRSMVEYSRV